MFAAISLTPVAVDDGVRVDVTVTETPPMAAGIALAITDENGTSAGPALKMTSIAGHPLDLGVITRFGGETLVALQEISPQLTNRRLWHNASLLLSDHFNGLEQFEQRSVDLDTRIGFRWSEQWRSGAIFKFYGVGSDASRVTLSPDDHDSFKSIGGGGIGLRLYIPYVNMIRLDLSVGSGVHGGLGIGEKAVAQRNRVR